MKKICFISTFAYPLFNKSSKIIHGGAEIDLFFIAEELANHENFEVFFVTADFGQPNPEKFNKIVVYSSWKVNLTGCLKYLYSFFGLFKFIKALKSTKSEIFVQEAAGIETLIVSLFCRLTKKKFVYRVSSTVECDGKIIQLHPFMGRLFLLGLRLADAIVTEDQEEVDLLKQKYNLKAQAIYDTTPLPNIKLLIPVEQRRHIIWVGRLVKIKRPDIFLDLVTNLPYEKFIIIAATVDSNDEYTKKIIVQAKTLKNTVLIPGLKYYELDEFYRYSKLLINTSDFEGYPNTFIEAGKYGVPIITLNVDPDKLLSLNNFGECARGNINILIDTVSTWLKNIKKREVAGQAFREYVEKTNDIHKNIQDYISLFDRLSMPK
ncbi:MAG: glycosyltransferase family 4 protein [Patescibacteria group bacterium]|jgi:glycosyltransferase involved in cell wall biosynthesis